MGNRAMMSVFPSTRGRTLENDVAESVERGEVEPVVSFDLRAKEYKYLRQAGQAVTPLFRTRTPQLLIIG